jgi:hypothetical protein
MIEDRTKSRASLGLPTVRVGNFDVMVVIPGLDVYGRLMYMRFCGLIWRP